MPLRFSYGKYDLKKEEFPLVLYDMEKSLDKWASHYTLDVDLSFKKAKDLASIHNLFQLDAPIYYVKGRYRDENLSKATLLNLVSGQNRIWLFMTFKGNSCADFEIILNLWNPHFRGFEYYKPTEDNHPMSEIHIRPLTSSVINGNDVAGAGILYPVSDSRVDPRRWNETDNINLRRAIYDRVAARMSLPSFNDFIRSDVPLSNEIGLEINSGPGFRNQLVFRCPVEHESHILTIFHDCLDFAQTPVEAWGQVVGKWTNITNFLSDQYTRKSFKIEHCGVNTLATGAIGSFKDLDIKFFKNALSQTAKPIETKIRWENIECANHAQHDFESYASLIVERRRLRYSIVFLLHCEEFDSESHRSFINTMKDRIDLPFDKPKYWSVAAYSGRRYEAVIEQIKEFSLRANTICNLIGEQYRSSAAFQDLKVRGYYDSEPGLFVKSDIRFNATVKAVMKERAPLFQYDPHTSSPIHGAVSFVQRDDRGLYNYITFLRDPHWHSKIFILDFMVSRYPIRGGIPTGFWWKYSRNSRDFIESDLWWYYETKYDLISAIENTLGFVEDVGAKFFREIGSLLLSFNKDKSAER